jgi:hypothetical protein
MSSLKASFATLDKEPHPHEAALLDAITSGNAEAGAAAKEARAVGITWQSIFALLAQFGPQFATMIQAILAALKTPVPKTMAENQAERARAQATHVSTPAPVSPAHPVVTHPVVPPPQPLANPLPVHPLEQTP